MATPLSASAPIPAQPEFADILRQDERFDTNPSQRLGSRINGWFDRLMLQSGLNVSPSMMVLYSAFAGILLAAVMFVIQENLLTTALGGMLGATLPILYAVFVRSRRQKLMMEQLPGMIEELARASRTGRSLEQSLQLVAEDTPQPLGGELQLVGRRLQLGLPLRDAVEDLPERTGLISLNVFSMALKIHQETGGDLIRVLERLSTTIRDRMLFLGRLRAATIASRATAILMISLPPLIVGFFLLRDPEYLTRLLSSSWGTITTLVAIVLQIVGSIWIVRILRSSQRT